MGWPSAFFGAVVAVCIVSLWIGRWPGDRKP